jgi:transposase-like protein
MKKRYTEEQIIGFLREADAGLPVKELCRKHGFSEPSYYAWKAKFGGMAQRAPPQCLPRKHGARAHDLLRQREGGR